jgi:hypothetical protein
MEREISRVHKLATPLHLKRNGSNLLISDGTFKHEIEFKEFGEMKILGSDADGFITFEITKPQQTESAIGLTKPFHVKLVSTGFSLIGKGTPKSLGGSRATYEYYKRSGDEYYYSKVISGTKIKKIHLGSLQEESSHISKIMKGIQRFGETQWFDRKMLSKYLESPQRHGQKLKSALDILTIEGYLDRQESKKRGRPYEQYKTTSKLQATY